MAGLKNVAGTLLGFFVEDVDAEFDRLTSAVLQVVMPLVTEPWGQRRFQVAGPDGLLVEVLQRVAPDPLWLADNVRSVRNREAATTGAS